MSGEPPIRRVGRAAALVMALRAALGRRRGGSAPGTNGAGAHLQDRSGRPLPSPPPGVDFDPAERTVPSNRRAEGLVAGLLFAAAVCGFGFTALYATDGHNTQLLGLAFGGALALLAAAAIVAGKAVVPQEISVEPREPLLEEDEAEEVVEMVEQGGRGSRAAGCWRAPDCSPGPGWPPPPPRRSPRWARR